MEFCVHVTSLAEYEATRQFLGKWFSRITGNTNQPMFKADRYHHSEVFVSVNSEYVVWTNNVIGKVYPFNEIGQLLLDLESPTITVDIGLLKAIITRDGIKVGCQTFSLEKAIELESVCKPWAIAVENEDDRRTVHKFLKGMFGAKELTTHSRYIYIDSIDNISSSAAFSGIIYKFNELSRVLSEQLDKTFKLNNTFSVDIGPWLLYYKVDGQERIVSFDSVRKIADTVRKVTNARN